MALSEHLLQLSRNSGSSGVLNQICGYACYSQIIKSPLQKWLQPELCLHVNSGWFHVTEHQRHAEPCGHHWRQDFRRETVPLPFPSFASVFKASSRAGLVCLGRCLFNAFPVETSLLGALSLPGSELGVKASPLHPKWPHRLPPIFVIS